MNHAQPQPTGPNDGGSPAARILLAEDHLDSREALCALLEAFGFEVIEAANGAEAIELARERPPDLVLMDIMMPEVDGFEATRKLRDFPETRDIPIITLTAMEGAESEAIEAGADDFLAKPINSGQLLEKVRDWLAD
ncbi:MAG: response regulator [Longimicrobiales bacterium]|nr:response regulator [Longimicrobiales bacterium]